MKILSIILVSLVGVWVLFKTFTRTKPVNSPIPFPEPTPEPTETFTPDPNEKPVDEEIGEMPIKPAPVNCQLAGFQPAPQEFFYYDCCGEIHEGIGFEPYEKRAPVKIDVNKDFKGMDLLNEEAEFDC